MKLYICLTYYHSLITLIKSFVQDEKFELWLANDIPDYELLKDRLYDTNRFTRIRVIDAISMKNELMFKSRISRVLREKRINKRVVEEAIGIALKSYKDIYIYHDFSPVGKYLISEKIPYHLLEDALDYFKYFDKYYKLDDNAFTPGTLKFTLKGITGFHCWGMSNAAIDIEVNDLEGIKIPKEKCFAIPRKALFDQLSDADKVVIFNTFAAGKKVNATKGRTAILCTQPLFQDKFVRTMEEQEQIFTRIVETYTDQGYHVVIKPHPRDIMDYTMMITRFGCDFIDKNLPSEVLNFNPDARFDVAISITSTAINFLEYAQEKRFMGKEYISEVLGNEK